MSSVTATPARLPPAKGECRGIVAAPTLWQGGLNTVDEAKRMCGLTRSLIRSTRTADLDQTGSQASEASTNHHLRTCKAPAGTLRADLVARHVIATGGLSS
jgi:hypothetical protein